MPDGSCQECLVPYASLLNHSPYPHIVQYGQLDPATGMLAFPLFRPISKGQQCFLSYGPLPNLKLLLFYGMAVPDNPHDVVPLQLQVWALQLYAVAYLVIVLLTKSLQSSLPRMLVVILHML